MRRAEEATETTEATDAIKMPATAEEETADAQVKNQVVTTEATETDAQVRMAEMTETVRGREKTVLRWIKWKPSRAEER